MILCFQNDIVLKTKILLFTFFTFFLSVFFISDISAQDASFSQYYSSPIYLNPAFAGSAGCSRIAATFRDQWSGISGNYKTAHLSYDQYVHPVRGGVAIAVTYDVAASGIISTTNVDGIYSYHLNIMDKVVIKLAVEFSWFHKGLNTSALTFGDMIDKKYGFVYQTSEPINQSNNFADFSTGLLVYTKAFFGGVAVYHLTAPNESFIGSGSGSAFPRRYAVHLGYTFSTGDSAALFSFTPDVFFQEQGNFQELLTGAIIRYDNFLLGCRIRNAITNLDAIISMVGFQTKLFKVSYSYDYTISELKNSGGTHEVSLSFFFNCKNKKDKIQTLQLAAF